MKVNSTNERARLSQKMVLELLLSDMPQQGKSPYKLNSLFMHDSQLINSLKGIGFEFIEKNNFLKKNISNFAMGF